MTTTADQGEPALDLDDEVEGDALEKALPAVEGEARKLPHRYAQKRIDQSATTYRRAMHKMLDEIHDVLTAG